MEPISTEAAEKAAPRTLILGYGNVDRGDDSIGYYVINRLARRFGHSDVEPYSELPENLTDMADVLFQRQLMPEMAEVVADYDRVIFVDAHTGAYNEDIRVVDLTPGYSQSPLTHHLTAESLLALTEVMFGRAPQGVLCSARGYEFDFTNELSEGSRALADRLVEQILAWLGVGTEGAL
jgi:hydrogenase maturation protease